MGLSLVSLLPHVFFYFFFIYLSSFTNVVHAEDISTSRGWTLVGLFLILSFPIYLLIYLDISTVCIGHCGLTYSGNKLVLSFLSFSFSSKFAFTLLYLLNKHVLLCYLIDHYDLCPHGLLFIYPKLSEWPLVPRRQMKVKMGPYASWNSHITSNLFC